VALVAGVLLALVAGLATWWLARTGGPWRSDPWPGLTWRGAALLLACGALLAAGQLMLGVPRRPWPDLVQTAVLSLAPLALATRIVRAAGAASAVCGAYLLPRALLSLLNSSIELPPPLIVPAMLFDLGCWLRRGDLRLPLPRGARWQRKERIAREVTGRRAAIGGALYGASLVAAATGFAEFLNPETAWLSNETALAAGLAGVACALLAACLFV
jgi:hypothetical protein